jgi:hypothetical protein
MQPFQVTKRAREYILERGGAIHLIEAPPAMAF